MSEVDEKRASPRRIGVREFRGNLTGILRQVRQGSSFIVTSRDEILAELHPPSAALRPRRLPGALHGQIRLSDDFDSLPPELLDAMEGGQE